MLENLKSSFHVPQRFDFPAERAIFHTNLTETLIGLINVEADLQHLLLEVCLRLPPQPVDATHALNLSAGVSNPKVLRGRSLS